MYQVWLEGPGDAAKPLENAASIDDARRIIRESDRPGTYALYEGTGKIEGWRVSAWRRRMVLTPARHLWEREEPDRRQEPDERPHPYQRGDGWSARPSDEEARTWVYYRPDGTEIGSIEGGGPDQVATVLAKIDELIDEAD